MKSHLLLTAIFSLVLTFSPTNGRCEETQPIAEKPLVKIGAVLPLSGGLSHLGSAYRDAMILALEDFQSPKNNLRYELVFEDDQGQLKETASAANKLLNVDKVDAIVSMWSNQGRVVAPIAEKANRTHFACAWDKDVADSRTTFNLSATPDYFMDEYVSALKERNVKRLIIIELNDSGGRFAHDILERKATAAGIQVVKREQFNSGDRDFRSLITSLRATPSDAIYLNAGSPELEIIARGIHELRIPQPVTTIGCFDFTTDLTLFEGTWYMTMTWASDSFNARYKKRFNRDVVYQLGNYYDMVGILIQAFENRGSSQAKPSTESVVGYIDEMKTYDGSLGTLKIDSERAFQSAPTFFKIEGGKRVRIE